MQELYTYRGYHLLTPPLLNEMNHSPQTGVHMYDRTNTDPTVHRVEICTEAECDWEMSRDSRLQLLDGTYERPSHWENVSLSDSPE